MGTISLNPLWLISARSTAQEISMPPKSETVDLIFRVLDRHEHPSPQAVLQELQRQGLNQADAKEGLSYLINDEQLELTSSSELRRLMTAAA